MTHRQAQCTLHCRPLVAVNQSPRVDRSDSNSKCSSGRMQVLKAHPKQNGGPEFGQLPDYLILKGLVSNPFPMLLLVPFEPGSQNLASVRRLHRTESLQNQSVG